MKTKGNNFVFTGDDILDIVMTQGMKKVNIKPCVCQGPNFVDPDPIWRSCWLNERWESESNQASRFWAFFQE